MNFDKESKPRIFKVCVWGGGGGGGEAVVVITGGMNMRAAILSIHDTL